MVIFALVNFMSVLFSAILLNNGFRKEAREPGFEYFFEAYLFNLRVMGLAVVINIIMIVLTTAKSFRIYHSRAAMDTLGCLPVSYKQRFWGDFLSVVSANLISFIPFYLISLIIIGDMKGTVDSLQNIYSIYNINLTDYPPFFSVYWLTMLLINLGTYAVTALVCSCCGKKGSTVLYSFVTMAAFSGIYLVYGKELFSNVIGVESNNEIAKSISMLPPFGPIVSYMMSTQSDEMSPLTDWLAFKNNPFYIVIYLLLTAVFIAGAYLIGKRRRAENVGESFVFKSAYHTLTLMFMIMLIGASTIAYSNLMEDSGTLWVMLLSFIVYTALEVSQNKGFKGFWKTAVRFAAVFGACFAFITLIKTTNSFGIYKILPSAGSVKEVKVSGSYFYTPWVEYSKEYTLDEKQSVSAILNEHKKLFDSDSLQTGNDLNVTYVMKTGQNITRRYSAGDDAIKNFSLAVRELPDFDFGSLGVIDEPDTGKYDLCIHIEKNPIKYIRGDRAERFLELLRYDIKNNYYCKRLNQDIYGRLFFEENAEKHDFAKAYLIFPTYQGTIEFLEDPDNFELIREKNETDNYRISYGNENMSICVYVSTEDTSAAAKELLSYIKPKSENDSYDSKKGVRIQSGISGVYYTIDPADEEAVLKAMLALFGEKHINKD